MQELKSTFRSSPSRQVSIDYPIVETLGTMADLLAAVEGIERSTVSAVYELPHIVRSFTEMIEGLLGSGRRHEQPGAE
jgi:hypothetical protein